MPASYRAAQGPEDKCNFLHALTTSMVNDQASDRLLEGYTESPWNSVVSAFFVGRELSKRAATFQEAKRARSLLGSL